MRHLLALALLAAGAAAAPADERLEGIACRSVHLAYPGPAGSAFYSEMTPARSAPGTYFMTCGWGKGYFGLQESGDGKKVVLFSVWDPAGGDDPKQVPDEKRVKQLAKGAGVRVGRFGNEGTGGQAFLDADWHLGATYRFLVTAAADPADPARTAYAGYFRPADATAWQHLATFSTPAGGERLRGYYSFVEDFRRDRVSATKVRSAGFGNGWVRSLRGEWVPLAEARFTADANPARTIDAGLADGRFFLSTGGGTENKTTKLRDTIRRDASGAKPPADLPGQ